MKKRILTSGIFIALTLSLCLSLIPAVAIEPTSTVAPTPTAAPTAAPTATPTAAPTPTPTAAPTPTPTATPTAAPTPTPTPNSPPVAENLEFCTFRCVSFSGKLMAVDPDGELVTFEISTEPRKGTLKLYEDGTFVYTPLDGKKGKDYFGYRAVDVNGNKSQEATVIIRIEKQKTKVTYSDMVGTGGEYAAIALAESDIFVGPQLNGQYMFEPTRSVTRGEFLAMCMNLTDARLLTGVQKTGFADDDVIPAWVKPYVSTALLNGYISGYGGTAETGGPVFDSEAPISYSEAAVILNRILNVTDVAAVSSVFSENTGIPVWATQAAANLGACRVITGIQSMSSFITRQDAADMLLKAGGILENRK